MRDDMDKVIVERPRIGSRSKCPPKGEQRRLRRYGEEGPPSKEGISKCWLGQRKFLNEHLGPLRRYLDQQVGRPWDKVFSEICQHINRGSAVQDHVRDHVDRYVFRHVLLIDGVPCDGSGGRGHGQPLVAQRWRNSWYVCPRTGLLHRVPPRPRKQRPKPKPPVVRVSETVQCHFVHGAWHLVTLAPRPPSFVTPEQMDVRDVLLGRPVGRVSHFESNQAYGGPLFAVTMRPLARSELRSYPIPARWWT
jgi:hypothetical protein